MTKVNKTRYPGVSRLPDGKYQIRVKAQCLKTGRMRDTKQTIHARNVAHAAERREELRRELTFDPRNETSPLRLGDYAEKWLRGKVNEVAVSTAKRYATTLDLHILPELGDIYLHALTQADIVAWRDRDRSQGAATVNGWLTLLKTLLADATADLGLPQNAAVRVRALPTGPRKEGNCLSAKDMALLLETAEREVPEWHPLFATLALTGMRFGEASALAWEDISDDFITVRRAQCRGILGRTKTGKTRVVPLLPQLKQVLKDHRRRMMATQAPGFDSGWVFPSRIGELLHGPSARKPLLKALAKAGIEERFTIHGFRHTFNNLLRQQASGEVVRAMTGHSTERMTEHYSHVDMREKTLAARRALRSLVPDLSSHRKSGRSGGKSSDRTKKPAAS